jgi:glycosyltransferase involved in cell wall biosynthesis
MIDESSKNEPSYQLKNFIKNFDSILGNTIVMYKLVLLALKLSIESSWLIHEADFGVEFAKQNKDVIATIRGVDNLIFYHKETADKYKEYRHKNIELIRLGTESVFDAKIVSTRDDRKLEILHMGSIEARKGQDILLKAIKLLPKEYAVIIRVRFVGRVYESDFAARLKEESKNMEQIIWEGNVSRGEVTKYMNETDIFVCTSRDETGPLVVLEAMSCGKAIISTDVGSVKDMLDNGNVGYVIPNEDVDLLVERLICLIKENALRKELGSKAYDRFNKHFTAEAFAERISKYLCG